MKGGFKFLAVPVIFAWLLSASASTGVGAAASNQEPSLAASKTNLPAASNTPQASDASVSGRPRTFSKDPGAALDWFVDGSAAVFGLLAVFFAIVTVVITIVGIITGIVKFRDLIQRIEKDLHRKVEEEFGKRLDIVVEEEIRPKVKEIIETELRTTIEAGKARIETELSKTFGDPVLREELIQQVAVEIRSRLSVPQSAKVEQKEFDQ